MRSRILSNAIANYAGQVTIVLVTFVLTPALLAHLGDAMYGVLLLVSAVQGLGGLFDFGITTSVVKYVAEHHARDEIDEINRVVSTSFFLHLVVGLMALLVVSCVALFGIPLFNLQPAEEAVAQPALILAGVSLMISLPLGAVASVLQGLRHYEITNVVAVVQALSTAGVTLFVLQLGGGPVELMIVNTVSLALAYCVRVWFALRLLPGLRLSPGYATRATLKRIGGYSVWLFMLDMARRIFYNADAVLIAAFLPVSKVTAYNLGFKPASALTYFSSPFVSVLLPAASALEALKDQERLRHLFVTATRIAVVVTMPVFLWLILFGRQVLEVWVGPGHEDALPVLYIFCAVFLVSIAQNPGGTVLRGIGQVRILALVVMSEYAANIILSLLLLPRVGVIGAAIGTLIPAILVDLLLIPLLACRALSMTYVRFVIGAFAGPLVAAGPAALLFWLLSRWLETSSLLSLIASGVLSVALFGVCYFLLGATAGERVIAGNAIKNVLRRARQGQAPR
ncbi:MAG: oligosaccharide flippase family protein [Chloroflexia bacterium]